LASLKDLQEFTGMVVLEMAFWLPGPTALWYILPLDVVPPFPPDSHDVVNTLDSVARPRTENIPSEFFGAIWARTCPNGLAPCTFLTLGTIIFPPTVAHHDVSQTIVGWN